MKVSPHIFQVDTFYAATEGGGDLLTPEMTMVVFTWVTFGVLFGILYRFAWKPILAGLDKREETIRQSLDEADKTHAEYERVEEKTGHMISDAEGRAKEIIAQARKAGSHAAKVIEQRAKEEAQIILENARREVRTEFDKAEEKLRRESAELATSLASRILDENLDTPKHKRLIDKYIEEIA